MSEFEKVKLVFTATLMTNAGYDLDRDELWDALNSALDSNNENSFLVGRTELEIIGEKEDE